MRLTTTVLIGFTISVISTVALAKQADTLPAQKNLSPTRQESVLIPGSRIAAGDETKNEFYILGENEPDPVIPKQQNQKVENKKTDSNKLNTSLNDKSDSPPVKPKVKLAVNSAHHAVKREKLVYIPSHHKDQKKAKLVSNSTPDAIKNNKEKIVFNPTRHEVKKVRLTSLHIHHIVKKQKFVFVPVHHKLTDDKLASIQTFYVKKVQVVSSQSHHAANKKKLISVKQHALKKHLASNKPHQGMKRERISS